MWSALVPGGFLAWQQRRRALRDLKNNQRLDESIPGLDDSNPVNRAKVALETGDPVAALQFWNEAVARYPGFANDSPHALTILLGLRLFDEAEALMREGRDVLPAIRSILTASRGLPIAAATPRRQFCAGTKCGKNSRPTGKVMSKARSVWRKRASWTRRKR